jgi:hypothetical protein
LSATEQREEIQESLNLAKQGYNDVGVSIEALEQLLAKLQKQVIQLLIRIESNTL